ncbi:MAG: SPASM domain-containing protein [Oscillospiraceae bacterium]|nr:SPASM domain-containing protein [Oscillospiraceae bacterium]
MKRFQKIYLEITNLCNLRCAFCPGTARPGRAMTEEEFSALLPKLRPYTDYLYFHLMGEPLCHARLGRFLFLAGEAGFRVVLTTNGVLLPQMQATLLASPALHKVHISLHAFEGNDLAAPFDAYLAGCCAFGLAAKRTIVVYRLWNLGGADRRNGEILETLRRYFPEPWCEETRGTRLRERVYLQYGEKFDWPDLSAPESGGRVFCHGLRDQLGVLCDGTVVPCCLDHEGDIALGNLFSEELADILQRPRARAVYDGFSQRNAPEPLCRRCGFATRFQK